MSQIPEELILPTFSVRLVGRLVVFVGRPGLDIGDDDWLRYVEWLKELQRSSQIVNRELNTNALRLAVLLSDPKLVVVVRILSWFIKSARAFRAHELEEALAYLEETDVARVRTTIRELGGFVHTS